MNINTRTRKTHFWPVCLSACLFVCLYVCVSVCLSPRDIKICFLRTVSKNCFLRIFSKFTVILSKTSNISNTFRYLKYAISEQIFTLSRNFLKNDFDDLIKVNVYSNWGVCVHLFNYLRNKVRNWWCATYPIPLEIWCTPSRGCQTKVTVCCSFLGFNQQMNPTIVISVRM